MELISYLQILQHKKWVVFITAITAIAVAVVGHAFMPVTYKTSAVVRIIPYSTNNPSYNEIMYADRVMKTYLEIGSSSAIMTTIRENLGFPLDRDISVDVEIIPDTELLRITVKDRDPVLATDTVNALAASLINDKTIRDVRVMLLEPAVAPASPSVLSIFAYYVLAIFGGVLGGMGLAFILENIDPRLYDEMQVKNITKLPILCSLPSISGLHQTKLLADRFPYSHAFQRLSVILQTKAQEEHLRTILITSSDTNEGKSTVAINLAGSLARSGCKTLLVDADIYRPTLHKYFGLANEAGISNLLYSDAVPKDTIQMTEIDNLSVVAAGSRLEILHGLTHDLKKIKDLFKDLSEEYEFLILDAPACLELVDSMILASLVDGVLIVARVGVARPRALGTTYQQLEHVHANMVGVVINGARNMYSKKYFHDESSQKNGYVLNFNILRRKLAVKNEGNEVRVKKYHRKKFGKV